MNERYVIVYNRNGPIPLRHVVTLKDGSPYSEDEFKEWYYSIYHQLEGDEFLYCADRKERDEALENITKGEFENG